MMCKTLEETMGSLRFALTAALACMWGTQADAQTFRWESLDGPHLSENRTHLRYPDGERVYIGSRTGTYRSTDGGASWSRIALTPGRNLTVYPSMSGILIGVCDTATFSTDKRDIIANAVYTSADRGKHWIQRRWARINGFANAFASGDTVYQTSGYAWGAVGGATSIVQSADGGATWKSVLTASAPYGFTDVYTHFSNVFARVWNAGGSMPDQTKRSTDGGTTWQVIEASTMVFEPPNTLLRLRGTSLERSTDNGAAWSAPIAASAGFSSLVTNHRGTLLLMREPDHGIFRSANAGASWDSLGFGPGAEPLVMIRYYGYTNVIGKAASGRYYRSGDHGSSWTLISSPSGMPITGSLERATDSLLVIADGPGWWHESADGGESWRFVSNAPFGSEIATLMMLPPGRLCAGGAGVLAYKHGTVTWQTYNRLSTVWALAYRGGSVFYAGEGTTGLAPQLNDGTLSAYDTTFASLNAAWKVGGLNQWAQYANGQLDYRTVYPLSDDSALAGRGGNIQAVNRTSTYYGTTRFWLQQGTTIRMLIGDSSTIWAGIDTGGVFGSSDHGLSWTPMNEGLANREVLTMAAQPLGVLFVGTRGGGVFRSTNRGATWEPTGLSGQTVQTLATSKNNVLAGSALGAWLSTDMGETWREISDGLGITDVRAIAVGFDGTIYCGTWGGGVYKLAGEVLEVPPASAAPSCRLEQNYPNPFNPSTVISYQLPVVSRVKLAVYDLLGRQVAVLVEGTSEAGVHEATFEGSHVSSGVYFCRLEAHPFIGSGNRATSSSYVETRKLLLVR